MIYRTAHTKPHGKGTVRAFSAPESKWVMVNWKYVWRNPDIYPQWQPTESYRWTGSQARRNAFNGVDSAGAPRGD